MESEEKLTESKKEQKKFDPLDSFLAVRFVKGTGRFARLQFHKA